MAKGLSVIGSHHRYLKTENFLPTVINCIKNKNVSSLPRRNGPVYRKRANLSEVRAKELDDMEVQVCAFCVKENPPGEDNSVKMLPND